MDEQKHSPHASTYVHYDDGAKQEEKHSSQRPRLHDNDKETWQSYWEEQGQSWRTEPEISHERQEVLARCRDTLVNVTRDIYPFKDMKLDRADVEWLLATHENGYGPIVWSDEQQRTRKGLDLRCADLRNIDLRGLPMAGTCAGLPWFKRSFHTLEQLDRACVYFERADLREIHLEGATLRGAHLEGVNLRGAFLEEADLSRAHLEGANCREANFKRAVLIGTHLEGADFPEANLANARLIRAHLEGVHLREANLENADLRRAFLDIATNLDNTIINDAKGKSILLAGIHWGDVDLTMLNWSHVILLGEEHRAQQAEHDGEKKTKNVRLREYQEATRANRQLAVALEGQGLNEDAVRFAYRANLLQRKVLWYQIFVIQTQQGEKDLLTRRVRLKRRFSAIWQRVQRFGSYIFSLFLDVLAGYGYKPERTLGWYLLVVFCFALTYTLFGKLSWWPDALVYSLTSFHGRGFLPGLNGEIITLHSPLVVIAAFEAVIGLLIELSFIATFTQRFFGK